MGPHEWHALRQVAAALTVWTQDSRASTELQDRIFQTRCTFHSLEHELKGKKTEESFPSFLCTICPSRGTDAAALHTHALYAAEKELTQRRKGVCVQKLKHCSCPVQNAPNGIRSKERCSQRHRRCSCSGGAGEHPRDQCVQRARRCALSVTHCPPASCHAVPCRASAGTLANVPPTPHLHPRPSPPPPHAIAIYIHAMHTNRDTTELLRSVHTCACQGLAVAQLQPTVT